MPRSRPGRWSIELRDPALCLAEHPAAYWTSLLAAGVALVLFLHRALATHGRQRWLWIALSCEQAVQVIGIAALRSRAHRAST